MGKSILSGLNYIHCNVPCVEIYLEAPACLWWYYPHGTRDDAPSGVWGRFEVLILRKYGRAALLHFMDFAESTHNEFINGEVRPSVREFHLKSYRINFD